MFDCLLPCLPQRRHQTLEEQWASERTRDAIRSLEAAGVTVREGRLLGAPCAKSVASALIAIGDVAQRCDGAALG